MTNKPKGLINGVTGDVVPFPHALDERSAKIALMRDRLDVLAREAREAGNDDDAACLDAGSFALTFVMKESQEQ